jgi:hypothetical protein
MPIVTLHDFLTEEEILRAIELSDHAQIRDQIIVPNRTRIDRALGQENDTNYLAYAVEYVLREAGAWGQGLHDRHRKCADGFREDPDYACSDDCPGRLAAAQDVEDDPE